MRTVCDKRLRTRLANGLNLNSAANRFGRAFFVKERHRLPLKTARNVTSKSKPGSILMTKYSAEIKLMISDQAMP